jgi:hypothetical protein
MRSLTRPGPEQSFCVGIISLLIGISYGIAYGMENGNQLVYLPPGLRLIDPRFLQQDWWASETSVYHISFTYLIALLQWLHLLPWAAAVGNILLISASYGYIFRLVQSFAKENAFTVWIIFVFIFLGIARSQSVAASYLFDAELQASSVASFATVLALYLFVAGRPLGSGIALAAAGLFHANFLILGILCFGLAQLFLGWRSLIRRGVCQLLPSLLVLAVHVPLILMISGNDLPPEMRAEAQRLIIEVAAPYHYQPRGFLVDFIPLIGWNIVALAVLRTLPGSNEKRKNFIAIYLSLLLVITVGTLLTTVVMIDFVSRLFVWRFAPFLLICAHMIISFPVARFLMSGPARRSVWVGKSLFWTAGLGFALTVILLATRWSLSNPRVWVVLMGLSGLVLAGWWVSVANGNAERARHRSGILILYLSVGLLILRIPNVIAATHDGLTVTRNFNLLAVPPGDRSRIELYRWARTTEPESRFLIPPMLSGFRLHAGRAVYVDWKGRPFRPDELIEWHRRIKSITGLDRWRSWSELDEAYDRLSDAQIQSIASTYKIRYVILDKAATGGRTLGKVVFENDAYVVVRIADGAAFNAGGGYVASVR